MRNYLVTCTTAEGEAFSFLFQAEDAQHALEQYANDDGLMYGQRVATILVAEES